MNVFVDFDLVTQMDMLVGTVSAGMFMRVTGGISCVLMLVQVSVHMLMAMDMLMFVSVNLVPMGVLVATTVYMLMAMFMAVLVRPFHFCLLLFEPHFRLLRCGGCSSNVSSGPVRRQVYAALRPHYDTSDMTKTIGIIR